MSKQDLGCKNSLWRETSAVYWFVIRDLYEVNRNPNWMIKPSPHPSYRSVANTVGCICMHDRNNNTARVKIDDKASDNRFSCRFDESVPACLDQAPCMVNLLHTPKPAKATASRSPLVLLHLVEPWMWALHKPFQLHSAFSANDALEKLHAFLLRENYL